jgi:hypothetical protein
MSGGSKDMILAVIGLVTLPMRSSRCKSPNSKLWRRGRCWLIRRSRNMALRRNPRDKLREALGQSYDLFWRGTDSDPNQLKVEVALTRWKAVSDVLGSLGATTAAQKEALAVAKSDFGLMEQTRLLMSLQLSSPVAWPLIISVLGWSMFLFCGFGVLSGANPTTVVALGLGAVSVASAMFLVLDLSQPYSGLFRVPATALQQTIEAIDK